MPDPTPQDARVVKPTPASPAPAPATVPAAPAGPAPVRPPIRNFRVNDLETIGGSHLLQIIGQPVLFWGGRIGIDADGSPHAYHRDSGKGLDRLANAGEPGNWYGIATDPHGVPYIQKDSDPAPGFYVSTTSLQDYTFRDVSNPRRYVDSEKVPYIVLPGHLPGGAKIGDFATVINKANGKMTHAVCGDTGPGDEIGEGSILLNSRLGVPGTPRSGGLPSGLIFIVYPGSRLGVGVVPTLDQIEREGAARYAQLSLAEIIGKVTVAQKG